MPTGNVTSGSTLSLTIDGDPDRVLIFDPTDMNFQELFALAPAKYMKKKESLDFVKATKSKKTDKYGVPANADEMFRMTRELLAYARLLIDEVFGEGSADMIYGKRNPIDMFEMLWEQVTDYVTSASEQKMAKYMDRPEASRVLQ